MRSFIGAGNRLEWRDATPRARGGGAAPAAPSNALDCRHGHARRHRHPARPVRAPARRLARPRSTMRSAWTISRGCARASSGVWTSWCAMDADFGRRSRHESLLTDGMTVLHEMTSCAAGCAAGCARSGARVDWLFCRRGRRSATRRAGVVGVIAPWNYPVNLALIPLVSALRRRQPRRAKPSEFTRALRRPWPSCSPTCSPPSA